MNVSRLDPVDRGSVPSWSTASLDQQLINVLQRARRDGVFIPWHYVCADYWLIIDDLGRMNRNALESLRLGELVEATRVRLIGASDVFDSSNQQSKIMPAVMSSFNEVFIDRRKAKVHREQTDAFKRGEIVQHPGFGYRLADVVMPGRPTRQRRRRCFLGGLLQFCSSASDIGPAPSGQSG